MHKVHGTASHRSNLLPRQTPFQGVYLIVSLVRFPWSVCLTLQRGLRFPGCEVTSTRFLTPWRVIDQEYCTANQNVASSGEFNP